MSAVSVDERAEADRVDAHLDRAQSGNALQVDHRRRALLALRLPEVDHEIRAAGQDRRARLLDQQAARLVERGRDDDARTRVSGVLLGRFQRPAASLQSVPVCARHSHEQDHPFEGLRPRRLTARQRTGRHGQRTAGVPARDPGTDRQSRLGLVPPRGDRRRLIGTAAKDMGLRSPRASKSTIQYVGHAVARVELGLDAPVNLDGAWGKHLDDQARRPLDASRADGREPVPRHEHEVRLHYAAVSSQDAVELGATRTSPRSLAQPRRACSRTRIVAAHPVDAGCRVRASRRAPPRELRSPASVVGESPRQSA